MWYWTWVFHSIWTDDLSVLIRELWTSTSWLNDVFQFHVLVLRESLCLLHGVALRIDLHSRSCSDRSCTGSKILSIAFPDPYSNTLLRVDPRSIVCLHRLTLRLLNIVWGVVGCASRCTISSPSRSDPSCSWLHIFSGWDRTVDRNWWTKRLGCWLSFLSVNEIRVVFDDSLFDPIVDL